MPGTPSRQSLKRPRHRMPSFVKAALLERGLMVAYEARPPYQQNDDVGWIARAKRDETKQRRLHQMLEELKRGNVYMKMAWHAKESQDE